MGKIREIVFESQHPAMLARFWAAALDGYGVRPYDQAEIARLGALGLTLESDPSVMVDGPGPSLCFQRIAERHYGNNRIHLDISVQTREMEVVRLCALGASVLREETSYTVLLDPEGNQFCVVAVRSEADE